jgi:DNA-binding NarL/FixJ family response regulator
LIGLALVDALQGHPGRAARCLGAVEALREQAGLFVPPQYQIRVDQARTRARDSLSDHAYAVAWSTGRANPQDVIAEALEQAGTVEDVLAPDTLKFSRREREVLALLCEGYSDREIATRLYISPRTASAHVAAILGKFGARSRAEAAVRAVREGVI